MKLDENFKRSTGRCHCCIVRLFSMVFILLALGGCRTSSKVVEETHEQTFTSFRDKTETNTQSGAATTSEERTDSSQIEADRRTSIEIKRDSAGRIIEIQTACRTDIKGNAHVRTEGNFRLYGMQEESCSEVADSVVSFNQTKKEEKKDYKFGTPLETYIGLSLCALIILFYIGDYIYRLWKRK